MQKIAIAIQWDLIRQFRYNILYAALLVTVIYILILLNLPENPYQWKILIFLIFNNIAIIWRNSLNHYIFDIFIMFIMFIIIFIIFFVSIKIRIEICLKNIFINTMECENFEFFFSHVWKHFFNKFLVFLIIDYIFSVTISAIKENFFYFCSRIAIFATFLV